LLINGRCRTNNDRPKIRDGQKKTRAGGAGAGGGERGRSGGEGRFAPGRTRQGVSGQGPERGKPEGGGGDRPSGESPEIPKGIARVRRTGVPRTRATPMPTRAAARASSVPAPVTCEMQPPGQSGVHSEQSVCQSLGLNGSLFQVLTGQMLGVRSQETSRGTAARSGCNCYKSRRPSGKNRQDRDQDWSCRWLRGRSAESPPCRCRRQGPQKSTWCSRCTGRAPG
jgi:hypothetical protein